MQVLLDLNLFGFRFHAGLVLYVIGRSEICSRVFLTRQFLPKAKCRGIQVVWSTSQEGNLKEEDPLAEQQNAGSGAEPRAGLCGSWGLWQRPVGHSSHVTGIPASAAGWAAFGGFLAWLNETSLLPRKGCAGYWLFSCFSREMKNWKQGGNWQPWEIK